MIEDGKKFVPETTTGILLWANTSNTLVVIEQLGVEMITAKRSSIATLPINSFSRLTETNPRDFDI